MKLRLRLIGGQREALWYWLPSLANRGLGFLLLPIFTRMIAPSEFGIVHIALVISGMVRLVVLPGIGGLYLRYGFQGGSKGLAHPSENFGTIIRVHLLLLFGIMPLLTGPVLWFSRHFSPEVPPLFIVIALTSLGLGSLQAPLIAAWRVSQRVNSLAAFEISQLALHASVTLIALTFFRAGGVSLLIGDLAQTVLFLPIVLPEVVRGYRRISWDRKAVRVVAKSFSILGPEALFYWALNAVDRYALNYFKGPETTGLFIAASQFGSAIIAIIIIAGKQWQLITYRTLIENAYPLAAFKRFYRETFLLFFILCAFIAVTSKLLGGIVLGVQYQAAYSLIPIVMMVVCFRIPFHFFSTYCWACESLGLLLKITVGSLLLFCGALAILVPWLGAVGAAWSGLFALAPFAVALHILGTEGFHFDSSYLRPWSLLAFVGLGLSLTHYDSSWIAVFFGTLLGTGVLIQARTFFSVLGTLESPKS